MSKITARGNQGLRLGLAAFSALLMAACAPVRRDTEAAFRTWLAAEPVRAQAFSRFEVVLREDGVADIVDNYQLWRIDHIEPDCVTVPFDPPPEEVWRNVVPALRFVRDYVEPAIGDVEVVSAYRSVQFNTCIGGARASRHRDFFAVDLVPVDRAITRETLIERLCPLHEQQGRDDHIGLGIYSGRRFHIDAQGFRGWGVDFRRSSFPCAT